VAFFAPEIYGVGVVEKVAFQFGSFAIYWYGVFVALGFLAGIWTAARRAPYQGLAAERVVDLGPWLIVGALVGARALYVISYWQEEFRQAPWWEIFMFRKGGLVFYGGFIGAAAACLIYTRARRLPLLKVADVMAPSIALGHCFGRLGCLMNGCCYGRPCDLPWAIRYPSGHESFPLPVHPTQIYESLLNLALYGALAWFYRRRKIEGQVFAAYLVGYALLRFAVEFFRGDYPVRYLGGWTTPAQLFSLVILGIGLALWQWLLKSKVKPT
jgi:phosphatidylglycerol---prolipoprotein diacylglyceryl transferase